MWYAAYKTTHNKTDADDIVHQSFLNIIKKASLLMTFDKYEKVSKYVLITVRNTALQSIQRSSRQTVCDSLDLFSSNIDVETEVITNFELEEVSAEIRKMNKTYSDALYLRYFLNLDYNDIADTLNISVTAARLRVFYGRKILRKNKGGEQHEE